MNRKSVLLTAILCLAFVSMTFGQSDIGFKGIGGLLGYIDPDIRETTFAFGPRADLGTIFSPNVGFFADLLYWGKSYGDDGFDWKFSSIYITALAKYYFGDPEGDFKPYGAGGLGMVFFRSTWDNPLGDDTTTSSDLAIHLIVGAEKAFSAELTGFAEFRYIFGGWDLWGIFVGLMYAMGG